MTTIKPITSEEVLARQVKEGSLAAQQANTTNPGIDDQAKATSVSKDTDAATTPLKSLELVPDADRTIGISYRLPLGAYLLAFAYFEAALIALFMGVVNTASYSQSNDINSIPIWEIIQQNREIWIVMVILSLLSISLISGLKILRWVAIAICVLMFILAGYLFFQLTPSIAEGGYSLNEVMGLSSLTLAAMAGLGAAMLLTLVTTVYLMRKKIAAVYE